MIGIVKLSSIDNDIDLTAKIKYDTNALHWLCEYYSHENLIDVIQICIRDSGYNALPV